MTSLERCISVTPAGTRFCSQSQASTRQEQTCIKAITSAPSLGTPLLPLLAIGSPSRHLISYFIHDLPLQRSLNRKSKKESMHSELRGVRAGPGRHSGSSAPDLMALQGFSRPYRGTGLAGHAGERRRQNFTVSACLCAGAQLRIRVSVVAAWRRPFLCLCYRIWRCAFWRITVGEELYCRNNGDLSGTDIQTTPLL